MKSPHRHQPTGPAPCTAPYVASYRSVMVMEVRPGLFVGGRADAERALQAHDDNAHSDSRPTHLLSLGCPLAAIDAGGARGGAPVRLAFDALYDEEDADLLDVVRPTLPPHRLFRLGMSSAADGRATRGQLEDAVAFIERALRCEAVLRDGDEVGAAASAAAPCVLVHCEAGESRSVAVVAAYLMRSEGHTPEQAVRTTRVSLQPVPSHTAREGALLRLRASGAAVRWRTGHPSHRRERAQLTLCHAGRSAQVEAVRAVRPQAEPNEGFWEQLRLWGAMGCRIDDSRPAFKYFRAQQLAMCAPRASQTRRLACRQGKPELRIRPPPPADVREF
jgi:hypothetical protein